MNDEKLLMVVQLTNLLLSFVRSYNVRLEPVLEKVLAAQKEGRDVTKEDLVAAQKETDEAKKHAWEQVNLA